MSLRRVLGHIQKRFPHGALCGCRSEPAGIPIPSGLLNQKPGKKHQALRLRRLKCIHRRKTRRARAPTKTSPQSVAYNRLRLLHRYSECVGRDALAGRLPCQIVIAYKDCWPGATMLWQHRWEVLLHLRHSASPCPLPHHRELTGCSLLSYACHHILWSASSVNTALPNISSNYSTVPSAAVLMLLLHNNCIAVVPTAAGQMLNIDIPRLAAWKVCIILLNASLRRFGPILFASYGFFLPLTLPRITQGLVRRHKASPRCSLCPRILAARMPHHASRAQQAQTRRARMPQR